ncbi:MAG: hypothetical protein ACOWWM_06530 [Desulfobacterales bacterium]
MKQKYLISRPGSDDKLVIQEYGELDKEVLSLLCEEAFEGAVIQKAMEGGREALINALRTPNMYPPRIYSERIAEAVETLYGSSENESVEIFFDDLQLLNREHRPADLIEDLEEESGEIDELLDEGFEEEYEDDESAIKPINTSIKIADDEPVDLDDDV